MNKKRIPDLVAQIQHELQAIVKIEQTIETVHHKLHNDTENHEEYLESLALKLHNFYTTCEKIFKRIAEDINGGVPDSYDWHRRLLETATLEIENVRPPVITRETMIALQDYLAFRHVVRNIYGFELRRDKIEALLKSIKPTSSMFVNDIEIFLGFLKDVAQ